MSKFVIECPKCGNYAEAKTGFFAKKTINCSCGNIINVKTDRLISRTCPHCGKTVVFDQKKGTKADCPVCHQPISTLSGRENLVEFTCKQCGIQLRAPKGQEKYTCPVCDHENTVAERLKTEELQKDGSAFVIKYEGDSDTLVWKHPVEDFTPGSRLIVHESQEAIMFRDGHALKPFTAGRYTLETHDMPDLAMLHRLGGDALGTFHSEVYFFNMSHQMAIKWGTPEKVNMLEPETQAPISLGARGILNLRIADSRKLLLKLVGTGGKLTRQDLLEDGEGHIKNYFRSLIQLTISTNLANIITEEKLDILQLDQQKLRMSAAMLPLLQSSFQEYGLVITEFLVMGIMLPQKGEVGYDAVQTILQMRQKNLTKSSIETETELKLAEMEAKKQLDIRIQENIAEVEVAHRRAVAQKGETSVMEAQYASQRKVAEATGDVEAERLHMQLEMERKAQTAKIEAEEMRMKGYSQKDVLQADVQTAYAGALGQMGANGGGGNVLGEVAGLGVTLGAIGGVVGMTREAMAPMMNGNTAEAAPVAAGWDCGCGAKNIHSNFCPDCGCKKPESKMADTWDCPNCGAKGNTAKFCGECGSKKPEAPAAWDCPNCGAKGNTAKFCGECGCKKPEAPAAWDCSECGNKGITGKFCPECGNKKP